MDRYMDRYMTDIIKNATKRLVKKGISDYQKIPKKSQYSIVKGMIEKNSYDYSNNYGGYDIKEEIDKLSKDESKRIEKYMKAHKYLDEDRRKREKLYIDLRLKNCDDRSDFGMNIIYEYAKDVLTLSKTTKQVYKQINNCVNYFQLLKKYKKQLWMNPNDDTKKLDDISSNSIYSRFNIPTYKGFKRCHGKVHQIIDLFEDVLDNKYNYSKNVYSNIDVDGIRQIVKDLKKMVRSKPKNTNIDDKPQPKKKVKVVKKRKNTNIDDKPKPKNKKLVKVIKKPKQEQKDDNTFINTFDRVYKKGDTIDDLLKDIQTKTSSKQTKYFYSSLNLFYDSVYLYALKNSDNDCSVVPLEYYGVNNYSLKFTIPVPSDNEGIMHTNAYTLSNILYSFIRCYNEKKILVIPIQIQFSVGGVIKSGHANVLIINYHNMTFERFEPSSQTQLYRQSYIDIRIESSIMEPIQKLLNVKFKYIHPYSECPDYKRVQDYENEFRKDEKYKTSPITSDGFCSAWSAFYMMIRLNYPSLSQGETINKIYSYLDTTPQGMYNFIMNFINYQDDLLKKVGLDPLTKEVYFDSKTGHMRNYMNIREIDNFYNKIENLYYNEWSKVTGVDSKKLKKITSNKKSFVEYGEKIKVDLPNLISQFKKEQKGHEPKTKPKPKPKPKSKKKVKVDRQCYRAKSHINYYFDKDNYKSLKNKTSTINEYILELDGLLNYNYENCKHTEKYKNAVKYRDMIYGSDDTIRKLWRGIWKKLNHQNFNQ